MSISAEFDEKFQSLVVNICAGKTFEQRILWYIYFISTIAFLEGASGAWDAGPYARILNDCAKQLHDQLNKDLEKSNSTPQSDA